MQVRQFDYLVLPLLALSAARRRVELRPKGSALALNLLAGALLALHFAFWIASVQQTSIVTSVVLVTAQPLFVALAAGPLLGERPGTATWAGIALATAGALVMVSNDLGSSGSTLWGDLDAVLGAVFASGYFLIGRKLQLGGQSWQSYVTLAYTTAAVTLVALAAGAGKSFVDYDARTYLFLVLLALVPQLIGHTALNRSLGYLPAASVAIAVLGEPVGATLLAIALLHEMPTLLQFTGGLLVLAGVYAGLRGPRSIETSTVQLD